MMRGRSMSMETTTPRSKISKAELLMCLEGSHCLPRSLWTIYRVQFEYVLNTI